MAEPLAIAIAPLGVGLEAPGKYRVLTSVAALGDFLMNRWPEEKRDDAWRGAVAACLRSLEAQANGEAARAAFVMAAEGAGISAFNADHLARPEPREKPKGRRRR